MRARVHRSSRGFALVEVVIGLALFALVLALLQASFFTGSRMMRTLGSRDSLAGDLIVTNRILERWIGSAVIDAADGIGFAGSSDTVRFLAQLDDGTGAGMFAVELAISKGPDGQSTVTAGRRRLGPSATPAERTELMRWPGPLAFRFSDTTNNDGLAWTDWFEADGQLPSRVRLVAAAGPLVTVRVVTEENLRCLAGADPEKIQRRECKIR